MYKSPAVNPHEGEPPLDSRLAGIAFVAVIVSTAYVLTLALTRHQALPLVMLQNTYPQQITSIEKEGKRFSFAYAFLARRDISQLEIRFCLLHSSPVPEIRGNVTEFDFADYEDVGILEDYLGVGEAPVDQFEVNLDGEPGAKIMRVYDLSRAIQPFSSPGSTDSIYSVFGVLLAGNGSSTFLRGISDFFYEREMNVEYLVVAQGEREDSYSSGDSHGGSTMEEAPKGGAVILKDVKKGETVMIQFTVVPHIESMPERTWNKNYQREFYQVVRAYADGELIIAKANRVEVNLI
jgi:hypothetical protein